MVVLREDDWTMPTPWVRLVKPRDRSSPRYTTVQRLPPSKLAIKSERFPALRLVRMTPGVGEARTLPK